MIQVCLGQESLDNTDIYKIVQLPSLYQGKRRPRYWSTIFPEIFQRITSFALKIYSRERCKKWNNRIYELSAPRIVVESHARRILRPLYRLDSYQWTTPRCDDERSTGPFDFSTGLEKKPFERSLLSSP